MRSGICSTPAPGAHGAEQGAGDGAPFMVLGAQESQERIERAREARLRT